MPFQWQKLIIGFGKCPTRLGPTASAAQLHGPIESIAAAFQPLSGTTVAQEANPSPKGFGWPWYLYATTFILLGKRKQIERI